jgi:hypothetical protein
MRRLLIAVAGAALVGLIGCGAEEKPPANAPIVQPQNSGAQPPADVKKGGRIPAGPKK